MQPAPTGLQRWLFRHRRPVRVGCVVFLLVLVGWAVYSFTQGMIVSGVLSVLICMSPISLWHGTWSVERLVAQHQVKTD